MADMRRYRRCRNCGAELNPQDSFCPQCGIDTEKSYQASPAGYHQMDPSVNHVRRRCRQENLEGNWSEDWGRTVDESRITPVQCILIGVMIILLLLLLGLGAFWMFGRSGNRSGGQRQEHQQSVDTNVSGAGISGDIITILDSDTGEPVNRGSAMQETETATEAAAATEAQQPVTIKGQPETASQENASSQTAASWSQPESSLRLLTEEDLAGLTYDELQMVINEIYARHGRIFKTPEIGSYFESQPWYEGTLDADHFDESVFSEIENQNIQMILNQMGDG